MDEKPKVVLITRNFPPMQGGMERLNWHTYTELGLEFDVYLVGPQGAEVGRRDPSKVCVSPAKPVWLFLIGAFWQTLRLVLRLRPELLVAGSGVAALPAVLVGRIMGVPVVTYLHGLDIVARHAIYQNIFMPLIRRSNAWFANSRFTRQAAVMAGIPGENITILNPGTKLPDVSRLDGEGAFRERIQAGNRPIILSVGRLTRRKGLLEFIASAFPEITHHFPDVLLVVIGSEPTQAIATPQEGMGDKIAAVAASLGLSANIRLLGSVDDATLEQAYMASRLHIFPVLDLPGDVEGFGMVAVEAAAHGVPTVAFDVGGVSDAIDPALSGVLVSSGDYQGMAEAVVRYLNALPADAEIQMACRRHAEKFEWFRYGEKLREICSAVSAAKDKSNHG